MNTENHKANSKNNVIVTKSNSEIAKRLKYLCEIIDGGADKLSEITGISRRTLGNYLSGRNEPKTSASVSICTATGANIVWFTTGEGPVLLKEIKEEKNGYEINLKTNSNQSQKDSQEQLFQENLSDFGTKMHDYKDAAVETGYEPPILIREAIKTVMFTQGLTKPGAIILINALKEQENMNKKSN